MKIVFMGTPVFATAILKRLYDDGHDIVGVVSQPDKKVGRKLTLTPTPVKQLAQQLDIPTFQPNRIKDDYQQIYDWNPDLIVTCAYGQMIPQHLLDFPVYGSLNVHASLLPKLRGGAPIHKAIIYGYEKSGVSIMRMIKKMDAGDYMLQGEVDIDPDDTTAILHDKLMVCGADLISKAIPLLENKTAVFISQDESEATFAFNISKEEEMIDLSKDTQSVYNQIRGLISWPVGYIMLNDKKLKIHMARKAMQKPTAKVGTLSANGKHLYLNCIDGCIELLEVQLEGKKKTSAVEFINGAGRNYL